jgi:flagellar hook-associated protein 2
MPSVDGIVSGLDTTALINAIVEAVAGPKYLMEEELEDTEELQDKVAGLKNRLEDMVEAMEAMDEATEFPAFASSLSEDGYVDVTLDSEALPGVYTVEITALASAESEVANGIDDRNAADPWGVGDIVVTYGGTDYTVTLVGGEDLDAIAEAISDAVDGVSAYVMDTGEDTGNYKLVIAGQNTGSDNTITVDVSGLTGGTPPTFTETVAAADAQATINGVSVVSSDSKFSDVVQGMSFSALQLTTGATTISVTRDDTALTEKVQGFVDAYNEVLTYYNTNISFDPDEGIDGAFVGDSTIRSIIGKIGSVVTDLYFEGSEIGIRSLAQIGIGTTSDGTLSFEASAFTDALDENYDEVVNLFTYDNSDVDSEDVGPFASLRNLVNDVYIDSDGLLADKATSIEESIEDLEDRIADFEDRLDSYADRLRSQFINMEIILAEIQTTQSYLAALFA